MDADTDTDTDPPEAVPGHLGESVECEFRAERGRLFGTGDAYEDLDPVDGGYHCACDVEILQREEEEGFEYGTVTFDATGDVIFGGFSAAELAPQAWNNRAPKAINGGNSGSNSFTEWAPGDTSWVTPEPIRSYTGQTVSPWGVWTLYLTRRSHIELFGGEDPGPEHYTDCSDYEAAGVFVRVSAVRNARLFAPKRPVTPLGLESDQDCQPGQTATTHFQLIDFPGMGHAVPLATGGHSHYAGSRVRTVTVTDWNHADELHVRRGGADLVLTPASPSGQIPVDNHWFGTTRWLARRVADGEAHGYPELDLGLECPATPPAPTVDQPVGYGLSLAQLQLALQQATGGVGLGAWLAAATDTNLPVYAVRVAPKLDPLPGGPTHSLRLVLRGSYALVGLPLTATGPDSWSLDVTEGPLLLHGTVTRQAGTLTLALESGSYGYDGLPLTLQPATLTIDALGGN